VLADPIVAQANQELAAAQAQPVPTEDEALQAEQHTAWAAYDFERCIVIFSRLLELHPDDAGYKEKLVTSYFNRGKQYETQGDERRASQLYYSALSLDPGFSPAQEAAEAFLQKVEGEGGAG
jgi:tetratricopeptide (TPR) repeat protein